MKKASMAILLSCLASAFYYAVAMLLENSFSEIFAILMFVSFVLFYLMSPEMNLMLGVAVVGKLRLVVCISLGIGLSFLISGARLYSIVDVVPICFFYLAIIMANDWVFERKCGRARRDLKVHPEKRR